MATLKEKILSLISDHNGLTDREITNTIYGATYPQQAVNSTCNAMNRKGLINRVVRKEGKIGNFIIDDIALRGREVIAINRAETPNSANFPQHQRATISLQGSDFEKVELVFQYFNRSNFFTELNASTLRQTVANRSIVNMQPRRYRGIADIWRPVSALFWRFARRMGILFINAF